MKSAVVFLVFAVGIYGTTALNSEVRVKRQDASSVAPVSSVAPAASSTTAAWWNATPVYMGPPQPDMNMMMNMLMSFMYNMMMQQNQNYPSRMPWMGGLGYGPRRGRSWVRGWGRGRRQRWGR